MKISVITATYNSAKTLRDTLDSILAQTYPDIESIIVDGASKDGTMDIPVRKLVVIIPAHGTVMAIWPREAR